MVFEITDKFYEEHLNVTDLQILMTAEEETGTGEDGYYNLMTNDRIGKNLQSVDITNNVVIFTPPAVELGAPPTNIKSEDIKQ